jgi:hypothetical protein
MKKQFGIYEVEDEYDENGKWKGYRCAVVDSSGKKQGKLYLKSDGRENYKAKPKDEDLEI